MDVTKPYEFIGFGAIDVTKPYEFIGFGAIDVTKPYEFIGCCSLFIPASGPRAANVLGAVRKRCTFVATNRTY